MRTLALLLLVACKSQPVPDPPPRTTDMLPSWNAGPTRDAITAFVESVVIGGADYVPPEQRIAVFDNDGTLWAEHPFYFQAAFNEARIREMAPSHPEWQTEEPFASLLRGDIAGVSASGLQGYVKMMTAVQGGLTTEEYEATVDAWVATARHPRFDQAYTDCIYQPMLEMLMYLRANDFQTWIVSGGEQAFMRAFTEPIYGIPPEQVVGTRLKKAYEVRGGVGVVLHQPEVEFLVDGPAKPVGIETQIGRRPILAFGNSDGDREMLEYVDSGSGKRLAVLIHHTDEVREWAYDRESRIGHLDAALDQAGRDGWVVVDMKADWGRVFPFEPAAP